MILIMRMGFLKIKDFSHTFAIYVTYLFGLTTRRSVALHGLPCKTMLVWSNGKGYLPSTHWWIADIFNVKDSFVMIWAC